MQRGPMGAGKKYAAAAGTFETHGSATIAARKFTLRATAGLNI